jgi:tetratricopeptide (TPR) repeat protein
MSKRLYILLVVTPLFLYGCTLTTFTLPGTSPPGQEVAAVNHIKNGKKHLRKGKCKQAIKQFEKAVEKNPRNSEANYWLGASHYRCGNYPWARNYWYVAIDLRLRDATWLSRVRTAIGFTFELEGNRNRAYSEYTLALKLDPENSVADIGIRSSKSVIKKGKGKGEAKGKKVLTPSSFRGEVEALIFLGL